MHRAVNAALGHQHHLRRHSARLSCAGLAGGIVVLAAAVAVAGTGKEGWALAARVTARWSVLWFLVAFSAGPLARLVRRDWTRRLVRERRGIGLGFFTAHSVHLAAVVGRLMHGGVPDAATLAGGVLAYLFVFAMAATSSDAAVHRLGARRWGWLHTAGQYYLWLIFAQSYLGALLGDGGGAAHLAIALALAAAMGLRLFTRLTRYERQHSASG